MFAGGQSEGSRDASRRLMPSPWLWVCVALLLAVVPRLTATLGYAAAPGDLAAHADVRVQGSIGQVRHVLRGPLAAEGVQELPGRSLVLARGGHVTLDFGAPVGIAALLVQAEPEDALAVATSGNASDWKRVWNVPAVAGPGLRTRWKRFDPPLRARHLRLRARSEGVVGLTAIRAYADPPEGFPQALPRAEAPWFPWLSLGQIAWVRLATALAGASLLLALWWVGRRGGNAGRVRRLETLLVAAALVAGLCRWDLFQVSQAQWQRTYPNHWDSLHYLLGSKYAQELGYTNLYHCITVADFEDGFGSLRRRLPLRELRDNSLVRAVKVVEDPERCTGRFTAPRWQRFKSDVAWFRTRLPPGYWLTLQLDHGYNPSPAWAILGGFFGRLIPLSDLGFGLLLALDPLLLVLLWALAWRTFGTHATCAALIVWGTSHAAGNWWTRGAYLREVWLFLSVLAVCGLRRGWPAASGFLLAYATLLRVFPGLMVLGLVLRALMRMLDARRLELESSERRFAAGSVCGIVVVIGLSLWVNGSGTIWQDFARNLTKHYDVESSNTIGAMTAFAHGIWLLEGAPGPGRGRSPGGVGEAAYDEPAFRGRGRRSSLLLGVGGLVLLCAAVRRQPDWVASILGLTLVPFVTDLASYYYVFLLLYAFLLPKEPRLGIALGGLALAAAALGVPYLEFPRALFVWSSYLTMGFSIWVAWRFAVRSASLSGGSPGVPSDREAIGPPDAPGAAR